MSTETESQLSELFAQLPEPDPELTEQALARAVAALPTRPRRPEPRVRAVAFVMAAAIALLAVGAGALAAVGTLHVSFGQATHQSPRGQASSAAQLTVPAGSGGIAATVDGRLWLTTASGLRLQGLPVTAAALSPHALYVAAGVGHSLVAMAPNGRRAWSYPTPGSVAAITWAPDGLRIAYIVNVNGQFRLYAIQGNGGHNRLLDIAVRSTRPTWRADSLAVAYLSAGGRPVIFDFGHEAHVLVSSPAARDAVFLAFAPRGDRLAVATQHSVLVNGRALPASFRNNVVAGLGWVDGDLAVALNARVSSVFVFRFGRAGPLSHVVRLVQPARIEALDGWGSRLTLALAAHSGVRVVVETRPAAGSRSQVVLQLPPLSAVGTVATR